MLAKFNLQLKLHIKTRKSAEASKGFTLIEAVVATALFISVTGSIMGVYLYTLRINRRADIVRTTTENARYLSEFLSKEIRNGTINYSSTVVPCIGLPSYTKPDYRLSIVNIDGDQECFFVGDNIGTPSASGKNLWLKKNGLSAVKVNSGNISFDMMNFWIYPQYDPHCQNPPSCTVTTPTQPVVTIIAKIRTIGGQDNFAVPIQTTISVPEYDFGP